MSSPDRTLLPNLLDLLEDDSAVVRESVLGKLIEYGPELETTLQELPEPPSEPRLARLRDELTDYRRRIDEFYQDSDQGSVIRTALFQVGELVRHRRYGYRGVVVARDLTCQASAGWYRKNRTRPDREQPWYHVLVHASEAVTYAAQTSLLPDESQLPVDHVLVPRFFEGFEDGRYIRNEVDWPSV